ncbi:MAG: PadR family transcriptional regulator [Bacteroidota bacterium]|jgi:DNA-binding PadR family transcriptional regulator
MVSKELLKGSLKSIILKLLSDNGRMYGYELTQKMEVLSDGKIKFTVGALYPILHKLENDGVVITESVIINNRVRIYYKLTKTGESTAQEKIKELKEFIDTIGLLIKPGLNAQLC